MKIKTVLPVATMVACMAMATAACATVTVDPEVVPGGTVADAMRPVPTLSALEASGSLPPSFHPVEGALTPQATHMVRAVALAFPELEWVGELSPATVDGCAVAVEVLRESESASDFLEDVAMFAQNNAVQLGVDAVTWNGHQWQAGAPVGVWSAVDGPPDPFRVVVHVVGTV